jgi:hypothetical protein
MGKAFYGIAAVFAELFRTMNENQVTSIAAVKRRRKTRFRRVASPYRVGVITHWVPMRSFRLRLAILLS